MKETLKLAETAGVGPEIEARTFSVPRPKEQKERGIIDRLVAGDQISVYEALRQLIALDDSRIIVEMVPREEEVDYQVLVHLQLLGFKRAKDTKMVLWRHKKLKDRIERDDLVIKDVHVLEQEGKKRKADLSKVAREYAIQHGFQPARLSEDLTFTGLFVYGEPKIKLSPAQIVRNLVTTRDRTTVLELARQGKDGEDLRVLVFPGGLNPSDSEGDPLRSFFAVKKLLGTIIDNRLEVVGIHSLTEQGIDPPKTVGDLAAERGFQPADSTDWVDALTPGVLFILKEITREQSSSVSL